MEILQFLLQRPKKWLKIVTAIVWAFLFLFIIPDIYITLMDKGSDTVKLNRQIEGLEPSKKVLSQSINILREKIRSDRHIVAERKDSLLKVCDEIDEKNTQLENIRNGTIDKKHQLSLLDAELVQLTKEVKSLHTAMDKNCFDTENQNRQVKAAKDTLRLINDQIAEIDKAIASKVPKGFTVKIIGEPRPLTHAGNLTRKSKDVLFVDVDVDVSGCINAGDQIDMDIRNKHSAFSQNDEKKTHQYKPVRLKGKTKFRYYVQSSLKDPGFWLVEIKYNGITETGEFKLGPE